MTTDDITAAAAHLAAWPAHRRVFVWRNIALLLWLPLIVVMPWIAVGVLLFGVALLAVGGKEPMRRGSRADLAERRAAFEAATLAPALAALTKEDRAWLRSHGWTPR